MTSVSAVLFARDLKQVADFYEQAVGMRRQNADESHVSLDCYGFNLIVHQIPAHLLHASTDSAARREDAALRLNFPVQNIANARETAELLGGCIDARPPAWAAPNATVFLGHDPEGNVFKVSESRET